MSTIPALSETELTRRRWTRGEFDRMFEAGVLPWNEDFDLWEGQVYRPGETRPRPWSQSEYHLLTRAGILGSDERVELLNGEILEKVTTNPPHAVSVTNTGQALRAAFGFGAVIREQAPSDVSPHSEPEPDVLVAPGAPDDYVDRHPTLSQALLMVEISDSTFRTDRGQKARLYARAGAPEYWIVNLVDSQLEIHRGASLAGYADQQTLTLDRTVTPLAAPQAVIAVSDLFPRAQPAAEQE